MSAVPLGEVHQLFMMQMKKAGSSVLFAAITEISDSILRGAETDGFNGLVLPWPLKKFSCKVLLFMPVFFHLYPELTNP